MKKTSLMPSSLIESVHSPTFAALKNQDKSRFLLLKVQEDLGMLDAEHSPKTNFQSIDSERQCDSERKKRDWNKRKRARGSMFCTDLWSARQLKEVRVNLDCDLDKAKLKSIARESTKLSSDYVEELDKHFLKSHPDYAQSKELMMGFTGQLDQREIPKLFNLDLLYNTKPPESDTENTKLITEGSSMKNRGFSQFKIIVESIVSDGILKEEDIASPRKDQNRPKAYFTSPNDSPSVRKRTLDPEFKPQFFTPQLKPKDINRNNRKSRDFIIKNKPILHSSTPKLL